jgi:hypothetical protein
MQVFWLGLGFVIVLTTAATLLFIHYRAPLYYFILLTVIALVSLFQMMRALVRYRGSLG